MASDQTLEELRMTLTQPYSKPSPEHKLRHDAINKAFMEAACVVCDNCPDTETARHALYNLTNARMWANMAIATEKQ